MIKVTIFLHYEEEWQRSCEVFNNSKWQPPFFEFSKYLVHFWCDSKLFIVKKLYSQKPAHLYRFKKAGSDKFLG